MITHSFTHLFIHSQILSLSTFVSDPVLSTDHTLLTVGLLATGKE